MTFHSGDKKLNFQQSSTQHLEFVYNPMGQRVLKMEKPVSGGVPQHQSGSITWKYTYYAYDANGQVMAIYDVVMNDYDIDNPVYEATNAEQLIYGAGRIGVIKPDKVTYTNQRSLAPDGPIWKNQLGKKNYELTNHLGNVNAVTTDRKIVNTSYEGFSFASSVEGWAAGADASVSQSGGLLNVTTTPGSNNSAFKMMTTVVGESYIVTVKANKGTTTGLKLFLFGISTTNLADGETSTISFTATSTSTALIIQPLLTSGSYSFSIDTVGFAPKSVYEAVVILKSDYYPFGMQMPAKLNGSGDVIGGHWQLDDYRFAYNGMEKDPEMKGDANSYTTEFRQYDPRLGRWLSLDPMMMQFPTISPYVGFDDNPIFYIDPYGLVPGNGEGANEGGGAGDKGKPTLYIFDKETPKNVEVTERYSCDKTYQYKLDNGVIHTLNVTEGAARKIKVGGIEYKATYSTDPEKAGEFIGYYTEDGSKKFAPKVLYDYAWNYFTSDKNFNKNLEAAFQHWFDNPEQYGWEDSQGNLYESETNYNCFEFALSLTSGDDVDYDNIMSESDADIKLSKGYQNVSASEIVPGKTVIRFSMNNGGENQADHMAIYMGKTKKGEIIIATKNAKSVQPKIMLLKDLCLQQWQFGKPAAMDQDETPYYNPH